jgi:hypothetical protein
LTASPRFTGSDQSPEKLAVLTNEVASTAIPIMQAAALIRDVPSRRAISRLLSLLTECQSLGPTTPIVSIPAKASSIRHMRT